MGWLITRSLKLWKLAGQILTQLATTTNLRLAESAAVTDKIRREQLIETLLRTRLHSEVIRSLSARAPVNAMPLH